MIRTIRRLLLLTVLATAGTVLAQGTTEGWEELDRRIGEGEVCLVCNQRVFDEEVSELRYRGRTFTVSAAMLADFAAEPERYFQELQGRSAMFDERGVAWRPMSTGWLAFGTYVLAGLIFAALCGDLAVGRARKPLPWFFAGLVGNAAALIVLLLTPRGDPGTLPAGVPPGLAKVPATREPVRCPGCGELQHPAASSCAGCGRELRPSVEPETALV